MAVIKNPFDQWVDPTIGGRVIYNANIYIGQPDTDPTIPENRLQVYYIDENQQRINLAQPLTTNTGGFTVISKENPKIIQIEVDENNYSITVQDRNKVNRWVIDNVKGESPVITINDVTGLREELDDRALYLTIDESKSKNLQLDQYVTITDLDNALSIVVASSDTGGFYLADLANGNKLKLMHNGVVTIEQLGVTPNDSTQSVRVDNTAVINDVISNHPTIKTIHCNSDGYYFTTGFLMDTIQKVKVFDGRKSNSIPIFYFNGVTERNVPTARRDTLETNSSLAPESEPTPQNTAIAFGNKTTQVGRSELYNIRIQQDANSDFATDKTARNGTGLFVNSGFFSYDRIVTEGWHVGSYEFCFVSERGMIEHIAMNIGFVLWGGTSSTLSAMFANGTNYDRDSDTFVVTYTTAEVNEFQGSGFVFGELYYSNFNSLAVDKIQTSYVVVSNSGDYRTHYIFDGCGSEFVQNDYYIDAPNATIAINGGQDWGAPIVEDVNRIYVKNRRFPAEMNPNLSAGCLVISEQTYELSNPSILYDQTASLPTEKGYGSLSYTRVGVEDGFIRWRVYGRLFVDEFEMKINISVNGSTSGCIDFSYYAGNNAVDFAKSFGQVKVNALRFAGTAQAQSTIDSALTDTTAATSGNYYVINKPALADSAHRIAVDVDIELRTGFSGDLAKTDTRPDFLTIKGIDY